MSTEILIGEKDAEVPEKIILTFDGSLDATNIEKVSNQVRKVLNSGNKHIIADFSKLRYLNSTALGHIISFSQMSKKKGGSFVLTHVQDNVYEIFDIVGATSILKFYKTSAEALAA
ncbi:MAG: hypothetical protein B6244_02090 [Candidatus Cloacimonetes bacterium 4572_55]|nr:MAG: hypothetical protein B6244_02090 [Candidatus Cloacimonetes bacterium 4572_55]